MTLYEDFFGSLIAILLWFSIIIGTILLLAGTVFAIVLAGGYALKIVGF